MQKSTKQVIFDYLVNETGHFSKDNQNYFTATFIASHFVISRSLASHYLNELFKEGYLIKVNERPVLFLHKQTFESKFAQRKLRDEYDSMNDFDLVLHTGVSTFSNVIGSDFSLRNSVENIKKALHYPLYGLPITLVGKTGSGKKYISKCIYEYCLYENLISTNELFHMVHCQSYTNLELSNLLFGTDGLLTKHPQFVVFNGVHCVCKAIQDEIVKFMDENPKTRCIFLCERWEEGQISSSLRGRLLNRVTIPSLIERTIHEKEELVLQFVKEEAKKVQTKVFITDFFVEVFVAKKFDNNIENIKNSIIESYANAYKNDSEKVVLNLSCIPTSLKNEVCFFDKEKVFELGDYRLIYHKITNNLFEDILIQAEEYYFGDKEIKKLYSSIEKFNEYIVFKLPKFEESINQYTLIVDNLYEIVQSRYKISLSSNLKHLLTYTLYCQSVEFKELNDFFEVHKSQIKKIIEILKSTEEVSYNIAKESAEMLEKTFSINLNAFLALIIILNLKFDNVTMNNDHATGILICHGYSTASSIAKAANTLLGETVYEAFDMPLDVDVNKIVEKINSYLLEKHYLNDVVILVDMGSLEQIGKKIGNNSEINIGIINNVTTSMALQVGLGILQRKNIEELLKYVSDNLVSNYTYYHKKVKEKAIIFTSESGMQIAEKMKELFEESIPKTIPIQMMSFDYFYVMQQDVKQSLLSTFDILFVAGTMDPKIDDTVFINIGDIVDLNSINQILYIFKQYMSEEEINSFTDDLIKNFSLTNVIESMTILNPKHLLNIVEKSVHRLERQQKYQIHPKILIGLYVHICCFVERMVKREPIKNYPDIEGFEEKHKDFIEDVRNTFKELMNHYSIEIPVSEIGYIYDYIHSLSVDDNQVYSDE